MNFKRQFCRDFPKYAKFDGRLPRSGILINWILFYAIAVISLSLLRRIFFQK